MGDNRAWRLLRKAESVAYWAVGASALARLPAPVGYRLACWRGDWLFRRRPDKRKRLARNLELVLGNEISPAAAQQVARDWFRLTSCEVVDLKRLRGEAWPLRRLVEIRGREHLEAALAAGKGAILCTGHFGSFLAGFSVLHASGFPVTTIGRWHYKYTVGLSSAERWFWERFHARPVRRHQQRPNIEPWPGRLEVAARAASALRANEVVTISIDAAPIGSDRARTVEVPFLGRQAGLLPGAVALAQATGAPVLMGFFYRTADYRHQTWEISAPMPVDGDTATALGRCAAELSAAIRRSPGHWGSWYSTGSLADLGLIQPQGHGESTAGPALIPVGGFIHDRSSDMFPAGTDLSAPGSPDHPAGLT